MEKKYIVHDNRYPEDTYQFSDYGKAVVCAIGLYYGATIIDAETKAILYVTYKRETQRVFITVVDGELRIKETNS